MPNPHSHGPSAVARFALIALAGLAACAVAPGSARAQTDLSLTLNLQNAAGPPGSIVAVVLRTYSSRGVGQGQVCMPVRRQLNGPDATADALDDPIAAVLGSVVFSAEDDAVFDAELVGTERQEILLQFSSPTGSINEIDGPLAVIYLRLRDDLVPDAEYEVGLDLPNTFLVDAQGDPIPIEARAGRLRIDAPNEPFAVAAAAEATVPGEIALLSLQTEQLRLLAGGRAGLRYDPAVAAGLPQVRIDPRYGESRFSLAGSDPAQGLVVVTFASPPRDLNRVPGDLIQISLPTRPGIPVGTQSPVSLDPTLTFVVNRAGQVLPLDIEAGVLEFIP